MLSKSDTNVADVISVFQNLNIDCCFIVPTDTGIKKSILDAAFQVKNFLKEQGIALDQNVLFQDNQSAMLLEKKGRASCGKRTRALNIRYFAIKDCWDRGELKIEYLPTDDMAGDFMTKPLQGEKFRKFRKLILGM